MSVGFEYEMIKRKWLACLVVLLNKFCYAKKLQY